MAVDLFGGRMRGKMDYAKEAKKQYFKYFCVWFVILGVLVALYGARMLFFSSGRERQNDQAPAERVYDYADVLTDQQEEELREKIARAEKKLSMDVVIVTFSQSVEGSGLQPVELDRTYQLSSSWWDTNMQNLADDFWDRNGYGYNRDFEGDGVLLLHNWYAGQNGEHLSTSGRAEQKLDSGEIDRILDTVDRYYDTDPFRAYSEFIDSLKPYLGRGEAPIPWLLVVIVPVIVAAVYAAHNLRKEKAQDTTTANTYLASGKPVINNRRDAFIRKSVITRHIDTSSGGSGGHSSGGGHHTSSSGASHGGGSHRH